MNSQQLYFNNDQGRRFAAWLDLPLAGPPVAYALFAHCFSCGEDLEPAANITRALARQGVATLHFDFTGLGAGEGKLGEAALSASTEDLLAAAAFLDAHYAAPRILLGHSLGGAAVLQAAARIPAVAAIATIAAPCDQGRLTGLLGDRQGGSAASGTAEASIAGHRFRIGTRLLEDLQEQRMCETIHSLRKPLLMFHSPVDTVVDIDNATCIFQAAMHPKSFISLDRADHLLSGAADSRYVGAMIGAWVTKYLDAHPEDLCAAMPGDNRIVARCGEKGYRTEICANGHPLIADEPQARGGTNLGPSPYELLAAALGACTAMTLRMYADRKHWPLKAAQVFLRHRKIHADDCAECETETGLIDHIDREVQVTGPLDSEQRQRLLEIADRCPVHRTLHSEIHVRTWLKDDANAQ